MMMIENFQNEGVIGASSTPIACNKKWLVFSNFCMKSNVSHGCQNVLHCYKNCVRVKWVLKKAMKNVG